MYIGRVSIFFFEYGPSVKIFYHFEAVELNEKLETYFNQENFLDMT